MRRYRCIIHQASVIVIFSLNINNPMVALDTPNATDRNKRPRLFAIPVYNWNFSINKKPRHNIRFAEFTHVAGYLP